jgi:glycerol-3-phosphate acyltransferase PlsY
VFVNFRGGKGVATSTGVFLALAPLAVGGAFVVWAVLVRATRIVSVASIASAAVLPVLVYVTQGVNPIFWLSLALAAFVIFAHRANLRRLLRGEEHRFTRKTAEVP